MNTVPVVPNCYTDLLEVFSKERATQLPPHRPWDCAINLLPNTTPPRSHVYPLSEPETRALETYIDEALAMGHIRPSTSPCAAVLFFFEKNDGVSVLITGVLMLSLLKQPYPLPLVPSALEKLKNAQWFTKLDLRSAYNLIHIKGDEWKTAFVTTRGHYEYLVMPYGLSCSPSVFQAFVNEVLRDMIDQWVIVFMDDILVFFSSLEKHVHHVKAVLTRLLDHQLYVKAEKCLFHVQELSFLGYNIKTGCVSMNTDKVSAVVNWPRPKSVKDLQRFLGFSNFYHRFIRGFSSVAAPLTSLLKGNHKSLGWSTAAEQAFVALKEKFTTAPVLRHLNPDLPFEVEVDASDTGIGAVLSQRSGTPPKLHPCAYYSRKLNPAERNYDVGNSELLAMKCALEEWRHWLEGSRHPFLIFTDHRNLEYIRSAKRLNSRQACWSLFFNRFNFSVTYQPGSKNGKADSLPPLLCNSPRHVGPGQRDPA